MNLPIAIGGAVFFRVVLLVVVVWAIETATSIAARSWRKFRPSISVRPSVNRVRRRRISLLRQLRASVTRSLLVVAWTWTLSGYWEWPLLLTVAAVSVGAIVITHAIWAIADTNTGNSTASIVMVVAETAKRHPLLIKSGLLSAPAIYIAWLIVLPWTFVQGRTGLGLRESLLVVLAVLVLMWLAVLGTILPLLLSNALGDGARVYLSTRSVASGAYAVAVLSYLLPPGWSAWTLGYTDPTLAIWLCGVVAALVLVVTLTIIGSIRRSASALALLDSYSALLKRASLLATREKRDSSLVSLLQDVQSARSEVMADLAPPSPIELLEGSVRVAFGIDWSAASPTLGDEQVARAHQAIVAVERQMMLMYPPPARRGTFGQFMAAYEDFDRRLIDTIGVVAEYAVAEVSRLWPSNDLWAREDGFERCVLRIRAALMVATDGLRLTAAVVDCFCRTMPLPWYFRAMLWTLNFDGNLEYRIARSSYVAAATLERDIGGMPFNDVRWRYISSLAGLERRLRVLMLSTDSSVDWYDAEEKRLKDMTVEERSAKRLGQRFVAPVALPIILGVLGALVQRWLGIVK